MITDKMIDAATTSMLTPQLRSVLCAAGLEFQEAHAGFIRQFMRAALEAAEAAGALRPFDDVLGEDEPISDETVVVTTFGPVTDYSLRLEHLRAARSTAAKIEEALK